MRTAPTVTPGISFVRKRAVRVTSAVASAGMLVGISLVSASPAMAATDADCNVGNTVDALSGGATEIQALLDGSEAVVCLSGTFVLASTLTYDRDLTIHGLTDAVLDGNGVTGMLEDQGNHELTVENIRFTNGSRAWGGAIQGYAVAAYDSQFDNNVAANGGAIQAYAVASFGSLFVDNAAEYTGGAVMAEEFVIIRDSTFRTNDAGEGGGVYSYGIALSEASTFQENTAYYGGGALSAEGELEVDNSTFVGNSATFHSSRGGAIEADHGIVRQSTFLNNTAVFGQSVSAWASSIELHGNIFAGSAVSAHLGVDGGAFVDLGANLFTTTQAAETELGSVQPTSQFGLTSLALFNGATLADNGGPTQTVALHAGSPALDAVPAGSESLSEDQRGVARPAVSDAGAYEFTGSKALLAATGSAPAGWLAGAAALLLAGAAALGLTRRSRRTL